MKLSQVLVLSAVVGAVMMTGCSSLNIGKIDCSSKDNYDSSFKLVSHQLKLESEATYLKAAAIEKLDRDENGINQNICNMNTSQLKAYSDEYVTKKVDGAKNKLAEGILNLLNGGSTSDSTSK